MQKRLHIISFDIPYPANYGGVIDVFYKIKALHEEGVRIILHCYQYGTRLPQKELAQYCEKVHYYPRQTGVGALFSRKPYIVQSRKSTVLLAHLLADTAPILFEGLHCSYWLDHPDLRGRVKLLRMHNVEWQYYRALASMENRLWRRAYFQLESWKLQHWEKKALAYADQVLAIAPKDATYWDKIHPQVDWLPPFHANDRVTSQCGKGRYILFHGKLSVKDNEQAALFLIQAVFSKIKTSCIIAGLDPSDALQQAAKKYDHIRIQANLTAAEMEKLLANAHLHVLRTGQSEGMKLKLLHALFQGRFCLVNTKMVEDTGLEALCLVRDEASEMIKTIEEVMKQDFSEQDLERRRSVLEKRFSNEINAQQILRFL